MRQSDFRTLLNNAPERGLKIQLVFVLVINTETFANEFA